MNDHKTSWSETSTNLVAAEGHNVKQASIQHIDWHQNHWIQIFKLSLFCSVKLNGCSILKYPEVDSNRCFYRVIKGYGHTKVKRSPPQCYSWLLLSLCHHLIQQMVLTLHFNKFSPWQGFINSILHLLNNLFLIIPWHNTCSCLRHLILRPKSDWRTIFKLTWKWLFFQ